MLLLNVKVAVLFVVGAFIGMLTRIIKEEKYLSANLPGYDVYIAETDALIPGVF